MVCIALSRDPFSFSASNAFVIVRVQCVPPIVDRPALDIKSRRYASQPSWRASATPAQIADRRDLDFTERRPAPIPLPPTAALCAVRK